MALPCIAFLREPFRISAAAGSRPVKGGCRASLAPPRRRLLRRVGIDAPVHRSWCSAEGIDRDLAEQALAHAIADTV